MRGSVFRVDKTDRPQIRRGTRLCDHTLRSLRPLFFPDRRPHLNTWSALWCLEPHQNTLPVGFKTHPHTHTLNAPSGAVHTRKRGDAHNRPVALFFLVQMTSLM